MVPHKGIRARTLRMVIARKLHSTGIKLYCLADMVRRGHPPRFGNSAGNFNA